MRNERDGPSIEYYSIFGWAMAEPLLLAFPHPSILRVKHTEIGESVVGKSVTTFQNHQSGCEAILIVAYAIIN